MSFSLRTAFIVSLLAAPALASNVWVVAQPAGPGVDFTSIQAAIDAAASGDTILVRHAQGVSYLESLTIDGKSLVITGDTISTLALTNVYGPQPHVVRNVPAGGAVVFRRMFLSYGGAAIDGPGLWVHDNAGSVWLEESRINGGGVAVRAERNAALALLRCGTRGGGALFELAPGYAGIECIDSRIAVIEGQVLGGAGKHANYGDVDGATVGGPALVLASGEVLVDKAELRGGLGGFGSSAAMPCLPPGDGGPGYAQSGGLLRDHQGFIHGGEHGDSGNCGPMGAVDGPASTTSGGVLEAMAAPYAGAWSNSRPLREGETAVLQYTSSAPGLHIATLGGLPTALPLPYGTLLQGGPFQVIVFAGATSGLQTKSFALVDLGPGVEGVNVVVQGSACDVTGACWAGSGAVLTILDASF
ncbi:MAG: hypothetical protein EPO68_04315 [Planctomycetota bacterium]|nr:MAG: hypothetical protein EPO68_04315 [Planctomycetota bacterium]